MEIKIVINIDDEIVSLLKKYLLSQSGEITKRIITESVFDINASEMNLPNAADIETIQDFSGFQDDFTVQTSEKAIFLQDVINGQPVIEFDDEIAWYENSGLGLLNVTDDFSLYIFCNPTTDQQSSIFSTFPRFAEDDFEEEDENFINVHLPYRLGSGADVVAWDFGDRGDDGRLSPLPNFVGNLGEFALWEFRVTDGFMSIYRNGEFVALQYNSSAVNFDDEDTDYRMRIGFPWAGDLSELRAQVGRIVAFDRYLGDYNPDRLALIQDISDTYGLGIVIPPEQFPSVDDFQITNLSASTFTFSYSFTQGNKIPLRFEFRLRLGGTVIEDWGSLGTDFSGQRTINDIDPAETYSIDFAFIKVEDESRVVLGSIDTDLSEETDSPEIQSFSASPGDEEFTLVWVVSSGTGEITDIEYELDGSDTWISTGSTSTQDSHTVTGVNNDQEYSVRLKVITTLDEVISEPILVTPVEVNEIIVDSYSGTDTQKINAAIQDAQQQDIPMRFADRVYEYDGDIFISGSIEMIGGQESSGHDETKSTIKFNFSSFSTSSAGFVMEGTGTKKFEGISFDADYTNRRPFKMFHNGEVIFDKCHLMKAWQVANSSSYAAIMQLESSSGSTYFLNGTISDVQSGNILDHEGGQNDDTAVRMRAINCRSNFSGLLHLENVAIFGIADKTEYDNGQVFYDNPTADWRQDIDGVDLSGDGSSTRKTVMKNVTIRTCISHYIKISQGGGELEWENVHLHIRENEPMRGRAVRLQRDGDDETGMAFYGLIKDCSLTYDAEGGIDGSNPQNRTAFSMRQFPAANENQPLVIDGFTVSLNEDTGDTSLFAEDIHRGDNLFVEIKNTTVNRATGVTGLDVFLRSLRHPNSSHTSTQNNHGRFTLEDNEEIDCPRFFDFRPDLNFFDPSTCNRLHGRINITLKGTNTFGSDGSYISPDINERGLSSNHFQDSDGFRKSGFSGLWYDHSCFGGDYLPFRVIDFTQE